jgi:hypothetical protein
MFPQVAVVVRVFVGCGGARHLKHGSTASTRTENFPLGLVAVSLQTK